MESSFIRIQNIRQDTDRQINEHYKARVQLQEQIDDHVWQLDFCRGAAHAAKEVEKYLAEGDLAQALLRLQSLRVETYCRLSECFKLMILLKDQLERNEKQLHFYRGVASTDGGEGKSTEAESKMRACCEMDMILKEQSEENEEQVHFFRGMIASMDEGERIINEEMNPRKIPSRVPTSPGAVGPNFEGQAMEKPKDGVKFPDYSTEYNLPNYPEFQPNQFGHEPLGEITG